METDKYKTPVNTMNQYLLVHIQVHRAGRSSVRAVYLLDQTHCKRVSERSDCLGMRRIAFNAVTVNAINKAIGDVPAEWSGSDGA